MSFATRVDRLLEVPYSTELKWCLLPATCVFSGKKIWMKKAYFFHIRAEFGIDEYMYGMEPLGWADPYEFMIWKLKV